MHIIDRKLYGVYSSYIHAEEVQNTHKSESNLNARLWAVVNRTLLKKNFTRSFLPSLFQGQECQELNFRILLKYKEIKHEISINI